MSTALTNDVAICNLALSGFLGKQTITSLSQSSVEASKCNLHYPVALETVATGSWWTFLRERTNLAQAATNPLEGTWDYAYDYPSRSLKLFGVAHADAPTTLYRDYVIEGGTIYTNLDRAQALYVTLEDKPLRDWSVHLKKALAAELAALLAPSMTRRRSDVEAAEARAKLYLDIAVERDAAQEYTRYTVADQYVRGSTGQSLHTPQPDGSTIWE